MTTTGTRRGGRERGSVLVTAVVLMVTVTGGAVLWLTRDVDRQIAAASQASAIALQAARAGAQQLAPDSLRRGNAITIDPDAAINAVIDTTRRLLDVNHSAGRVAAVHVDGDRITVTVEITEAERTVGGRATVHAAAGVTDPGD